MRKDIKRASKELKGLICKISWPLNTHYDTVIRRALNNNKKLITILYVYIESCLSSSRASVFTLYKKLPLVLSALSRLSISDLARYTGCAVTAWPITGCPTTTPGGAVAAGVCCTCGVLQHVRQQLIQQRIRPTALRRTTRDPFGPFLGAFRRLNTALERLG